MRQEQEGAAPKSLGLSLDKPSVHIGRRSFVIILLLGMLACLLGWWLGEPTGYADPFDRVILPIMAVWLLALALVSYLHLVESSMLEVTLFISVAVFFLSRLSYPLFFGRAVTDIDQELLEFGFYIPAFFALAFVIFNRKNALRAVFASLSAFFVMALLYLFTYVLPTGDLEGVYTLTQSMVSSLMLVLIFIIFVRQIEAHADEVIIMDKLAHTDQLTGLPNRRQLTTLLCEERLRATRYKRPFSTILCDIDNFKRVNDRHGHDAGDAVLKQFAEVMTSIIRKPDQCGRWGGEEFLIVLPETDLLKTEHLARRLQAAVGDADFGISSELTASFGATQFRESDSVESLLKRTDEALYYAKSKGRNTVVTG